jgi:hypothetical protein
MDQLLQQFAQQQSTVIIILYSFTLKISSSDHQKFRCAKFLRAKLLDAVTSMHNALGVRDIGKPKLKSYFLECFYFHRSSPSYSALSSGRWNGVGDGASGQREPDGSGTCDALDADGETDSQEVLLLDDRPSLQGNHPDSELLRVLSDWS